MNYSEFETQRRIAAMRQLREAIDAVYVTHGSNWSTTNLITHEAETSYDAALYVDQNVPVLAHRRRYLLNPLRCGGERHA